MNEAIMNLLKELSARKSSNDEIGVCLSDLHGGNFSDCYSLGVDDGEIELARRLLAML